MTVKCRFLGSTPTNQSPSKRAREICICNRLLCTQIFLCSQILENSCLRRSFRNAFCPEGVNRRPQGARASLPLPVSLQHLSWGGRSQSPYLTVTNAVGAEIASFCPEGDSRRRPRHSDVIILRRRCKRVVRLRAT